jgi:uncharacterized glyoxalase superfamily protein PhnB
MGNLTVQIFTSDLLETFEHYEKAFGAKNIGEGYGDSNELIHLSMDIRGNHIALAPLAPHEITKGNVTVLCLGFDKDEEALWNAFNVLKEDGQTDGLHSYPWSSLEGYVTDKYGVVWCIGL